MPKTKKVVVATIRSTSTRRGEFQRTSTRETKLQKSVTFIVLYTKSEARHAPRARLAICPSASVSRHAGDLVGPTEPLRTSSPDQAIGGGCVFDTVALILEENAVEIADTARAPRKKAIEMALAGTNPDILCVQEALEEQGRFLARIDLGDPSDAVLVAGDFNAPPATRDRRLFEAAGLLSSATLSRRILSPPTTLV
jgi:hypothetical protein